MTSRNIDLTSEKYVRRSPINLVDSADVAIIRLASCQTTTACLLDKGVRWSVQAYKPAGKQVL